MVRIPFIGGGKERIGEPSVAPAFDVNSVKLDPYESQVIYIARDLKFEDDNLTAEFRKLHPDMDEDGIQKLVGRVDKIRHPKPEDK